MAFDQVSNPTDEPAYQAAEAARIVGVPPSTVKAWAFGQRQTDGRTFHAVIAPADRRRRLISFANLCELHVLATIRRMHHVKLTTVRRSLKYVASQLHAERPLIARQFLTNGVDLFLEHAGALLNASQEGQQALRGGFEQALDRIEWSRDGAVLRLFPFTRSSTLLAGQPKVVVVDPRIAFGRPALVRAGVTTEVIEDRFVAGDSPDEMAEDYGVDPKAIWEALRFERQLAA